MSYGLSNGIKLPLNIYPVTLCPPLCRWGLSHLCTLSLLAGEVQASRMSGLNELPHAQRVDCEVYPIRQQFVTLWKYFYMLHAEKITTCALLELSHMKEPGRTPQWMLRKERDLCLHPARWAALSGQIGHLCHLGRRRGQSLSD